MSAAEHTIKTNAFQYSNHLSGVVDPRTGTYRLQIQLSQLLGGLLMGPELGFYIQYHFLANENRGFGQGWLHNLTRYDRKRRQLHLGQGQSYHVSSFHTLDNNEVELELRYANPHEFKAYALANTGIRVQYKSGVCEYLNPEGFLECIQQLDGRRLFINYYTPSRRGRIKSITDDHDQSLGFIYDESGVRITKNNHTVISLHIHHNELTRVVLADGASYQVEYATINNCRVIKQLTHPLGAIESLTYDSEGLRAPQGSPLSTFPAVTHHRVFGNDITTINATYTYSRHNYLGFASGAKFVRNKDNLYDRTHDYCYQSTEQRDNQLIKRVYNRFHLLITEEIHDNNKNIMVARRQLGYRADCTQPFDKQLAIYALPTSDITTYFSRNGEERTEAFHYEYDEYGNLISSMDPFGITQRYEYYSAKGEDGCPASPTQTPIYLKQKQTFPSEKYAIGTEEPLIHQYRYRTFPCIAFSQNNMTANSSLITPSFALLTSELVATSKGQQVSQRSIIYYNQPDNHLLHGRIAKETLLVGQRNTVDQYTYHQTEDNIQTVLHCIIDGDTQYQETLTHNICHEKKIATVDKYGVFTKLEYDALIRLNKEITHVNSPYQEECNYTYQLQVDEMYYAVTNTATHMEKYFVDGLGRIKKVMKTDASGTLQTYESRTYNSQGQLSSVTLHDTNYKQQEQQYTTYFEYNMWGDISKETLPSGLSQVKKIDKATNTLTQYLESTTGKKSQLQITRLNELQQPTDTNINGQTIKQFYDGFGQLREEQGRYDVPVYYQYDVQGRLIKESISDRLTIEKHYDPNSLDEWLTQVRVNKMTVGERTYDKLGRVSTETKQGLSPTHFTYTDQWPEPTRIEYPNQVIIEKALDVTLGLPLKEISSDQTINNIFGYTEPAGELVSVTTPHSQRRMEYQADGLIKTETQGDHQIHYQYSRQGNILSTTDFFNNIEQRIYDNSGRLFKIIQDQGTVELHYDEFDQVNKEVLITPSGQSIIHQYFYDNNARLTQKISLIDHAIMCRQSYSYNSHSKLIKQQLTDEYGTTTTEQYRYDLLGRLSAYHVDGPNGPRYKDSNDPNDAKEGVIQKQLYHYNHLGDIDRVVVEYQKHGCTYIKTQQFSYHEEYLGQLQSITNNTTITSLANGVDNSVRSNRYQETLAVNYDANGNLTQDEQGLQFQYNALNQVTRLLNTSGEQIANYLYDGLGQQITCLIPEQPPHQRFFSQHQQINESQGDWISRRLNGYHGTLQRTLQGQTGEFTDIMITDYQKSPIYSIQGKLVRNMSFHPFGNSH
ncbi:RHS repeat protein [Endozoicomonas sp. SM1973]|uniref:RHS repeat protein n=1 Tax=Spartinivicinus marinus TaxID=2994442 RepID=A0A853HT58_9GAMM|nr:RHS repeat protein [Spartinivicinus marinus]MCX4029385.1 RHS repeat protein [Spartinivicinus marinus]NYZ64960.1 RHS repeat protein [Spartinivicinus marinus]